MGSKEHFKIIYRDCGTGRSKVSLVKRRSDGKLLIWKQSRNNSSRVIGSYGREIKKSKLWREKGLSSVKTKWHSDGKSLIKTYIKGPTLKQVLKKKNRFFSKAKGKSFRALIKFVGHIIDSGYYIHDMKGSNIIFDGKKWHIIDGGTADKMGHSSVRKEYKKYLLEKWSRDISKNETKSLKSFLAKYI